LVKAAAYYNVSLFEFQSDLTVLGTTQKLDFINSDFLEDLKTLYHGDMHNNLNFKHFSPDALNARIKDGDNITFSIFHMNIHSLNKNGDELCQFLSTINHNFNILVLSKIWLYNITMYRNVIPGYTFYYDLPLESYVGGIGIYIKSSLSHCIVDC